MAVGFDPVAEPGEWAGGLDAGLAGWAAVVGRLVGDGVVDVIAAADVRAEREDVGVVGWMQVALVQQVRVGARISLGRVGLGRFGTVGITVTRIGLARLGGRGWWCWSRGGLGRGR